MVMGYSSKYLLTDSHESHDKKVAHPAPKPNSSHVFASAFARFRRPCEELTEFQYFSNWRAQAAIYRFLLPLILEANDEIEQRRQQIIKAYRRNDLGRLIEWGRFTIMKPKRQAPRKLYEELMKRVAPVPVFYSISAIGD